MRQSIDEGVLDQLGIRAIWLSPFQTNPTGSYDDRDGVHRVTGYHGYWPVAAREVDPRLGGVAALHAMVEAAHAHGIRVLTDFVVNHVHEDPRDRGAHALDDGGGTARSVQRIITSSSWPWAGSRSGHRGDVRGRRR